jgi:hypothetical protein
VAADFLHTMQARILLEKAAHRTLRG